MANSIFQKKDMDEYLDKVKQNRQSMVAGIDGYLRNELTLPKELRNHQDEALLATKEFLEKGACEDILRTLPAPAKQSFSAL